jgi:transposase-like protein
MQPVLVKGQSETILVLTLTKRQEMSEFFIFILRSSLIESIIVAIIGLICQWIILFLKEWHKDKKALRLEEDKKRRVAVDISRTLDTFREHAMRSYSTVKLVSATNSEVTLNIIKNVTLKWPLSLTELAYHFQEDIYAKLIELRELTNIHNIDVERAGRGFGDNNLIEADHGKLKRLIKPTLGFKSMKTAYATLKGFEVMRMFKKHQMRAWCYGKRIIGEIRLIERQFGIYNI